MERVALNRLRFDESGLIPVVAQDAATGTVLMVAYMNREALDRTLETGVAWYYSRSRQKLWQKGERSGHVQRVRGILTDCDQDALVLKVDQQGEGACHEGYHSCFHYTLEGAPTGDEPSAGRVFDPERVYGAEGVLESLFSIIEARRRQPQEGSYTTYLFGEGINKILKKVGEESAEVIIAAKDPEDDPLVYESADLIYHLLVLLAEREIHPGQVWAELSSRRGTTDDAPRR